MIPQPIDLTPCFDNVVPDPVIGQKIRIKIAGVLQNIWGIWDGTKYVATQVLQKGAAIVEIADCLPQNPANNTWITVYGEDYFYDATVSKWKCGRPNDR